jgi:hypothetical protein
VSAYEVDVALLRESRRLLVAVAKALGQWQKPKYQPIAFSTSKGLPSGKKHWAALFIADGAKSDLEIAPLAGLTGARLHVGKSNQAFKREWPRCGPRFSVIFRNRSKE